MERAESAGRGPAEPPWPSAARGWAAVAVLTFAYVVSFVDRQVLTLLVPAIKRDLLLTDTQISLLQGLAFGVFYTLLGLPLGLLADRGSRRTIIAAGATLWSAMTAACGLAGSYLQLFLARVGVGVGEAALNPAALSMISDYFPAERRALPIGVYVAAGSLGGGLAMIVGGAVIGFAERFSGLALPVVGELRGWQLVFVIVALPGLLIPLFLLLVREPARRGARLAAPPRWTDLFAFLRRRRTLMTLHLGGFAVFSMLVYGLISWTPTLFMRTYGWTAAQTGLLYGLTFLVCGVVGAVAGGALAARWRQAGRTDAALRVTAIGATAITVPSIAAPLVAEPYVSLALWGLSTFFVAFPSGASVAALQEVAPNELRAQATAFYYLTINLLGLALGALVVATLTDRVFADEAALPWSLAVTTAVLGPLAAVLLWRALPAYRDALAASASDSRYLDSTVNDTP